MCPALEICPPGRRVGGSTVSEELHCGRHSHVICVARPCCTEREIAQGGGATCLGPQSCSNPGCIPHHPVDTPVPLAMAGSCQASRAHLCAAHYPLQHCHNSSCHVGSTHPVPDACEAGAHSIDKKPETQTGEVTRPRSHPKLVMEADLIPGLIPSLHSYLPHAQQRSPSFFFFFFFIKLFFSFFFF